MRFRLRGDTDRSYSTTHRAVYPTEGYEKQKGVPDRRFDLESKPHFSYAGRQSGDYAQPFVDVFGPEPRGRFTFHMATIFWNGKIKYFSPATGARATTFGGTSMREYMRTYIEDIARRVEWEDEVKHRFESKTEGDFVVRIGKHERSFNDAKTAADYAEGVLKKSPVPTKAGFFRRLPSSLPPRQGQPWTEPFQVMENYRTPNGVRVGYGDLREWKSSSIGRTGGKTWTVEHANHLLKNGGRVGTFSSIEDAIAYAKGEAERSRSFVTFTVVEGTPRSPGKKTSYEFRGTK